jgi:hypothetical protein
MKSIFIFISWFDGYIISISRFLAIAAGYKDSHSVKIVTFRKWHNKLMSFDTMSLLTFSGYNWI